MLFIKIGYHPIAGLTMAYASAVGGFAANIVVGMQDALVYSFTEPQRVSFQILLKQTLL